MNRDEQIIAFYKSEIEYLTTGPRMTTDYNRQYAVDLLIDHCKRAIEFSEGIVGGSFAPLENIQDD